jgi:pyrroloquinoline quinone (PQQ) biosynthesis protein C
MPHGPDVDDDRTGADVQLKSDKDMLPESHAECENRMAEALGLVHAELKEINAKLGMRPPTAKLNGKTRKP